MESSQVDTPQPSARQTTESTPSPASPQPTRPAQAPHPPSPESLALARAIVDLLVDRKAADVVLLDISALATFADYFVICTGGSERQIQALSDTLGEMLKARGAKPSQVEGQPASGWVLLDCGDVVVHLFSAEARAYYRLERIWSQAQTVVRVQ